ncbi:hypothetical protein [Sediminibacillus albus]|nr:hypothetical protein [Sediminibacillus albus]
MNTQKLMYLFGLFSVVSVIIHFVVSAPHYTEEELISGSVFFSIAAFIFYLFVYLYFRSVIGKKIVMWGVIIITIALLAILINYDYFEKNYPIFAFQAQSNIVDII